MNRKKANGGVLMASASSCNTSKFGLYCGVYPGEDDFPPRVVLYIERDAARPGHWMAKYGDEHNPETTKGGQDYTFEVDTDMRLVQKIVEHVVVICKTDFCLTVEVQGCPLELDRIFNNVFAIGSSVCSNRGRS